jgi:hypothetical protein
MYAIVVKDKKKFRVVDGLTKRVVRGDDNKPIDGGGHATFEMAMDQAASFNIRKDKQSKKKG